MPMMGSASVSHSEPPTAMSEAVRGLKARGSGPVPVVMPFSSRIFWAIMRKPTSWLGPMRSSRDLSWPVGDFS